MEKMEWLMCWMKPNGDWTGLLKMHPKDDWMFNQIADDRDHMGMRIPKKIHNMEGEINDRYIL